jgi:hypothetical protein
MAIRLLHDDPLQPHAQHWHSEVDQESTTESRRVEIGQHLANMDRIEPRYGFELDNDHTVND